MIKVLNGGLITSTANPETIVPVALNDSGGLSVVGRHLFQFELVTGTVQTVLGADINSLPAGFTAGSHTTTSGTKWEQSFAPEGKDGGIRNLQMVGAGTVIITW